MTFKTNTDWHPLNCKILLKMGDECKQKKKKNYWELWTEPSLLIHQGCGILHQKRSDNTKATNFLKSLLKSYLLIHELVCTLIKTFRSVLKLLNILLRFYMFFFLRFKTWLDWIRCRSIRTTAFTTFLVQRQLESFFKFPILYFEILFPP